MATRDRRGETAIRDPLAEAGATFEALLRDARPIPLTQDIRVETDRFDAAIRAVEEGAAGRPEAAEAIKELGKLRKRSKPIPMADQVRFDRKRAWRIAQALHAAAPDA